MNSEYFGDSQVLNKKLSNYRMLGNSLSNTPRNKKINEFENMPKPNEYFHKGSLAYQSSIGSFREKRRSLLSLDSKDNYIISELQYLKPVKPKAKQLEKLSYLSVMNRTPQASAKGRRNKYQNNLNQSQSQNENDSDSVLNMSNIRKQIGLIKDFDRIPSFNQKDGDFTQTNRSRISKNEQTRNEINELFQKLIDVYDKEQINKTIQKVKNPKEREKIIDRIIKRREEIKDAEQIVQISRCAQLINRFLKKVKKNEDQSKNITQVAVQSSHNNIESNEKLSGTNVNDILSFTSIHQKLQSQQQNKQQQFQEQRESAESNPKLTSQDNLQQSGQVSPKQAEIQNAKSSDIITKGIALSAFMKQKDGFQKLLSFKSKDSAIIQTENMNSAHDKNQNEDGANKERENSASKSSYIRKDSRRLSLITKDNFFKNQLPANILPGSTDAKLYQINLNSITEKSKLLQQKGQESARSKANQLLKDFQKLNLASHFKSKSLNQTNFNNSEVNTFNFQRVIHKKQAESKISSLTQKQKDQMKALNQFLTYDEPQVVLNQIKEDVALYLSKFDNSTKNQETIDFFMPGQLYKFHEVNKIDRGALEKLRDIEKKKKTQLANLTKNSIGSSTLNHMSPLTSRYERENLKDEITQFSSCNNLDTKQNISEYGQNIHSKQRENSNHSQSSYNQFFSTSAQNSQKIPQLQNSKPYLFDIKQNPNSQIDKHIQQQLDIKKNNYKPPPQFKEKSSYQKNPLANILQDQMQDDKKLQKQSINTSKQFSYNKSIDYPDQTSSVQSLNYTTTLHPGNKKPFHLNKIFTTQNGSKTNREQSKKSKDDSKKIKYQKIGDENEDLYHDTKELNHSLSFASFTEIKLDQLYKQTYKIKNQINSIDTSSNQIQRQRKYQPEAEQKIEQQLEKTQKELKLAEKEIQETNQRKFKK